MILLFCSSYLDVRDDVDATREAHVAVDVDASNVLKGCPVDDGQRLEIAL